MLCKRGTSSTLRCVQLEATVPVHAQRPIHGCGPSVLNWDIVDRMSTAQRAVTVEASSSGTGSSVWALEQ